MSMVPIKRRTTESALLGCAFVVAAAVAEHFDAEFISELMMFVAAFEFGYAFACLDARRDVLKARRWND